MSDARWNHNIQYHPVVLAAIPPHARDVLDVGCGDGMLARRIAQVVPHVIGPDVDEASIRAAASLPGLEFVLGDVLTYPFDPSSFDAVVSIATLHHMDAELGLRRMAELLRPGGALAVVGCARSTGVRDLPYELAAVVAHQVLRRRRTVWEHPSPTRWPPSLSYRQLRQLASDVLPGSVFRRRVLWRYSLVWHKPAA